MKYILVLLTIGSLCLFFTTHTTELNYVTSKAGEKIYIIISPPPKIFMNQNQQTGIEYETNVQASAEAEVEVKNKNINYNEIYVNIKQEFTTFITNAQKSTTGLINFISTWIQEHKLRVACVTVFSIYSILNVLLCHYYYKLTQKTKWIVWQKGYSNAELFALPHKQLQEQLLNAIHETCANQQNPIDPSHALAQFIAEIDNELKLLADYKKLLYVAQRLPLSRFIITWHTHEKITQLHERLLFIKHIFFSWLSVYNCNQTQTC